MERGKLNEIFSPFGIELEEEIGHGGSARVYRISCPDESLEEQVLKVVDIGKLAEEFVEAGYPEALARNRLLALYDRELELNKGLTATRSEYLVRILQPYRIGSAEDAVCLCAIRMPCYGTLRSLRNAGPLEEKTVIALGSHICEALRVLHHDTKGEYYPDELSRIGIMLHTDIKPDNIFYRTQAETPTFMLGDFGTLVDKEKGHILSKTPGYFPPETGREALSETADIFSLGVSLYYCICSGDAPDAAVEEFSKARYRGESVARPSGCSVQLWQVIERATSPAPESRYQTAAQMHEALLDVAQRQKSQLQQANTVMAIVMAAGLVCNFVGKVLDKNTKVGRLEIEGSDVFYDGPLKNDLPCGKGVYSYRYGEETRTLSGNFKWVTGEKIKWGKDKVRYTGMKLGSYCSGWGILSFPDRSFTGTIEQGKLQTGSMKWVSGEVYEGTWISRDGSSVADGEGVHTLPDGSRYKGGISNGMYEGYGIMEYANGSVYEGMWQADKPNGTGCLTDAGGKRLQALWENGNIVKILE